MRSLLQLLARYSILLMFLALETLSLILAVKNSEYQRSRFFTSANSISGWTYSIATNISDYFHLKGENEKLNEEVARLQNENNALKNTIIGLQENKPQDYIYSDLDKEFINGKVINVNKNKAHNYLTINKGTRDGVNADMGVISGNGIVGIVSASNERFSIVIPVINTSLHISCKVKGSNHIGSLSWDGKDYRYANLEDLAKHIVVNAGDTIATSGYTTNFPEDMLVGVIEEVKTSPSDAYHKVRVRLATDFSSLSQVSIVKNNTIEEQLSIEQTIK